MIDRKIWTTHPASTSDDPHSGFFGDGWNNATPMGNGSLGAMVYGDPIHDTIQLNEETIWGGDDKLE